MGACLFIMAVEKKEWIVEYTTFLENFEGPLDLLLYLIKQEKVEIKDIFISKVTEQFLQYMYALPYIEIDKASEYLAIASAILEIKSISLLPNLLQQEEEEESQEDIFIQALEEYQIIKEQTVKLKELEQLGHYFKEPDKSVNETRVVYKDLHLDGLLKAFTELMLRKEAASYEKNKKREIPKEVYTVKDKINHIYQALQTCKKLEFENLFHEEASKREIITTFQALLEMLKYQYIVIHQTELYGKITIQENQNKREGLEVGEFEELEEIN